MWHSLYHLRNFQSHLWKSGIHSARKITLRQFPGRLETVSRVCSTLCAHDEGFDKTHINPGNFVVIYGNS